MEKFIQKLMQKDLSYFYDKMEELFLPEEAEDVVGVIKMIIIDGENREEWFVHFNETQCKTTRTSCADYIVKVTLTKETFIKTFIGLEPMEQAFNSGRVIVEGEVDFAIFLVICFAKRYLYDIWFYMLEDNIMHSEIKNKAAVYKFIIQNTPAAIGDGDAGESLSPDETVALRYVIINDNFCKILPFNKTNMAVAAGIKLRDSDLINYIEGKITFDELMNRSEDINDELKDSFNELKEMFALAG